MDTKRLGGVLAAVVALWLAGGSAPGAGAQEAKKSWAGTIDAPDFPSGLEWINVPGPLSLADLRGKVVVLDFWTYGCVNCMHNLPYLKRLLAEYPGELAVVGVHSAKFPNEGQGESLRNIVRRYGLDYPVVNDAAFEVWKLWGPTGWPSLVLVDPAGKVAGAWSGEGFYDAFKPAIAGLVKEFGASGRLDRRPLASAPERGLRPGSVLAYPGKVLADEKGGRLFVADSGHDRVVVASLADGAVLDVIGSGTAGYADGAFSAAALRNPQGLALSADGGTLYIADTGNHSLRRADLASRVLSTLAGNGRQAAAYPPEPGTGAAAQLSSPWDLALDGDRLYVAMAGSHQLWLADVRTGAAAPLAGSGAEGVADGAAADAELAQPSGLALVPGKRLYFADSEASRVRFLDLGSKEVKPLAGGEAGLFEWGGQDGAGAAARFQHPLGLAWAGGLLYAADSYNHRIRVVAPGTRTVRTLSGETAGFRDGARPLFDEPGGVWASGGKLYVADTNNHAVRVVDTASGAARTLAILPRGDAAPAFFASAQATRLSLPQQRVAPGAGELRLSVRLPGGFKPNPEAYSSFVLDGGREIAFPGGRELSVQGPAFPLRIAYAAAASGVLRIEVSLVYCRDGEESLCFLERRTLEIPVRVEAGAPTVLEAAWEVPGR